MSRLFRVLLLTYALFALFALPALAQSVTPPADPTDLPSVVDYLATGGAAVVVAVLLSWLAENVAGFAALSSLVKWSIQVGGSALLGVGAWYLITYQSALLVQLAPVFKALILAVLPAIGNQVFHAAQKALAKAPAA